MRLYECVFLFNPININNIKSFIIYFEDFLHRIGGKIYHIENWGIKKLAYSINKLDELVYIFIYIECNNYKELLTLNKNILYNKGVVRYLILKIQNIKNSISVFTKQK